MSKISKIVKSLTKITDALHKEVAKEADAINSHLAAKAVIEENIAENQANIDEARAWLKVIPSVDKEV